MNPKSVFLPKVLLQNQTGCQACLSVLTDIYVYLFHNKYNHFPLGRKHAISE